MTRALLAICLVATAAKADFMTPQALTNGWRRPIAANPRATYQAWEYFSTTTGPNSPQTVFGIGTGAPSSVTYSPPGSDLLGFGGPAGSTWPRVNSAGIANVHDAGNASFITSGGNIYSFAGTVSPRITIPNNLDATPGKNPDGKTTVLLQFRILGSDYLPSSLRISETGGLSMVAPQSVTLLASAPIAGGGFGGTLRDYAARFVLPGNADLYMIQFDSAGSSMSLDRVSVDTYWRANPLTGQVTSLTDNGHRRPEVVPEPSLAAALFLLAAAGAGTRAAAHRKPAG